MKKLIVVLSAICSLTACGKKYSCSCTNKSTGYPETIKSKTTYDDAIKACNSADTSKYRECGVPK